MSNFPALIMQYESSLQKTIMQLYQLTIRTDRNCKHQITGLYVAILCLQKAQSCCDGPSLTICIFCFATSEINVSTCFLYFELEAEMIRITELVTVRNNLNIMIEHHEVPVQHLVFQILIHLSQSQSIHVLFSDMGPN